MRFIVRALVCAGVSLTVVGCNTVDGVYSREGAGVDLYATEGVSTADAQEAYFAKICDQAGVICAPNSGPATWSAVVRAGMNDIDERCDGYLTWLDNVRRSQAPITKQLADTAAATALIMQATGSNAAAMAVVAAAFGFASNTFTNISSRLILEVPHSTVQAVVFEPPEGVPRRFVRQPAGVHPQPAGGGLCAALVFAAVHADDHRDGDQQHRRHLRARWGCGSRLPGAVRGSRRQQSQDQVHLGEERRRGYSCGPTVSKRRDNSRSRDRRLCAGHSCSRRSRSA